jgi:hypothetical protein
MVISIFQFAHQKYTKQKKDISKKFAALVARATFELN